jgi:hypothetical protein
MIAASAPRFLTASARPWLLLILVCLAAAVLLLLLGGGGLVSTEAGRSLAEAGEEMPFRWS